MKGRTPGAEARKERLAAMRARQAQLRVELKQRMAARKKTKKPWRPSRWWVLVVIAIVLLLFARNCRCTPEPEGPGPGAVVPGAAAPSAESTPTPPAASPLQSPRVQRLDRPALDVTPPGPPPWMEDFRLQVAARSPRLARCFDGVERPGQLKWTTSVHPVEGSVSEHSLEPMLMTGTITAAERDCLLRVLTEPAYRLRTGDQPSTPSRVGLVIEF